MSYCRKCCKRLANNTVYCYHCGTKNKMRKKITQEVQNRPNPGTKSLWSLIYSIIFSKEHSA